MSFLWKISYVKLGRAVRIPIEEVERKIVKGCRPILEPIIGGIPFFDSVRATTSQHEI